MRRYIGLVLFLCPTAGYLSLSSLQTGWKLDNAVGLEIRKLIGGGNTCFWKPHPLNHSNDRTCTAVNNLGCWSKKTELACLGAPLGCFVCENEDENDHHPCLPGSRFFDSNPCFDPSADCGTVHKSAQTPNCIWDSVLGTCKCSNDYDDTTQKCPKEICCLCV